MKVRFEPRAEGAPPNDQVEEMLAGSFPPVATERKGAEGVIQAFIGSRNTRQSARPDKESMEAMLGVVGHYMDMGRTIPILVPSGPKKNGLGVGVDLAELSALRMLGSLQVAARRLYEPGFSFVFRMEDATGHWLEGTEPEMIATIDNYINGMEHLVDVLGYRGFITLVRETDIVPSSLFSEQAAELLPHFLTAVTTGDTTLLDALGWKGGVSSDTVEFLLGRYRRLYPDKDEGFKINMVARYLAAAMGRVKLRASGAREDWDGGRLEITFQQHMPGVAKSFSLTRINYRTVPMKHGKLHMPYWRAKGVIKRKKGKPRYGLCHWGVDGYGEGQAVLEEKDRNAEVSCDFEREAD